MWKSMGTNARRVGEVLTGLPHDEQNLAPGAIFGVAQQLLGRERETKDSKKIVSDLENRARLVAFTHLHTILAWHL